MAAEEKGGRARRDDGARTAPRLEKLFAAQGRSLRGAPLGQHATCLGTTHSKLRSERERRRPMDHGREEGERQGRERAVSRERAAGSNNAQGGR